MNLPDKLEAYTDFTSGMINRGKQHEDYEATKGNERELARKIYGPDVYDRIMEDWRTKIQDELVDQWE